MPPDTTHPHLVTRTPDVVIIDLWRLERESDECPMCDRYRHLTHAVGWYCGPVRENPGEVVPDWGPDAIAGGMSVCQPCHDEFYGEAIDNGQ